MGKKDGKPRGAMTSYAFFVQTCREEHKKKHPGEQVVFAEFSRKCAEKWKSMGPVEKKRFVDMAGKDKLRYEGEMANYTPVDGDGKRKRKGKKDPNAPKRALSAFFFFCADERKEVKKQYPEYSIGEIAKELGRRWEVCPDKSKYEAQAAKDKKRYEQAMIAYKGGSSAPAKKARAAEEEEDEDEEEEEEEEEDEDE